MLARESKDIHSPGKPISHCKHFIQQTQLTCLYAIVLNQWIAKEYKTPTKNKLKKEIIDLFALKNPQYSP